MRKVLFAATVLSYPWLTGFVLLGAQKATLPVTPLNPQLTFVWDGSSPSIKDKDKFKDGVYQELDDKTFMQALLVEAMGIWNNVPDAYVTLAAVEGDAKLDVEDKVFSIVTEHSSNLSSAAYAKPTPNDDDETVIGDCDISIADHEVDAESLAFTIAHELGHCLGLGHAHTNYNAMMGYSRSDQKLKLGADDIAGVIYLYPDPTEIPEKPKELVCGGIGKNMSDTAHAELLLLLAVPFVFAVGRRRAR